MLISDAAGWGDNEKAEADRLVGRGRRRHRRRLSVLHGCAAANTTSARMTAASIMVSDIESLSQQVQRAAGNSAYHLPIVAGVGEGGALALAIAAQTPDATIGQTLAIDPAAGIPLTKELCTPAKKQTVGDRMIYGLSDTSLPDPIIASFTACSQQGRARPCRGAQEAAFRHRDPRLRGRCADDARRHARRPDRRLRQCRQSARPAAHHSRCQAGLRHDGGHLFRRRRLARYRQGGWCARFRSRASRWSASTRFITSGRNASRSKRRTISARSSSFIASSGR